MKAVFPNQTTSSGGCNRNTDGVMTMREKLIKLLQDDGCPLLYVLGENMGTLADYLIANGVTVQEGHWREDRERSRDQYLAKLEDRLISLEKKNGIDHPSHHRGDNLMPGW